ncbi:MAG: hypothetical protein VX938_11650, partial [Myxococcota bacterium]|nr:hypothetical protein [Myxococcota bacterium]
GVPESASCVCVPACDGKVCGEDGCGGECGSCAAGTACQEGACETQICTPGAPFCAGEVLSTCDALGLAATSDDTTDCAAEHGGQGACEVTDADADAVPESASCVCVPACDGKACGDDGCGGECGACGDGTVCLEGQCLDEICEPFNSTCISTSVAAVCNSTGTGHVAGSESACSGNQVCDGESCNDVVCDAGAAYCEDESTASVCNGTGTGPATEQGSQECGPGTICVEGSCQVVVCSPNQPYCEGPVAFSCNETGTGPDPTTLPEDCQPGTTCVNGACTAQTCAPGSTYCDENAVAICNETGTGPDPLMVLKDCSVTDDQFVCEEGDFEPPFGVVDWAECVCQPDCDGKVCGDDGCGEKCGNCPPGQSCTQSQQCVTCETDQDCGPGFLCLEQTCEEVICTPNESFCLSGSVLAVCNAVGTGPVSNSEQSCTSQGNDFVCDGGACICDSPCDGVNCGGDDPCGDHCICGAGEFCDLAGPFPDLTPGWMSLALGKCIPCAQGEMWCSDDGLEVYLCDSLPTENPTGGVVNVAGRVETCDPASPCQDNGDGTSSCGGSAGCEPNCGPTNECGSDGCGGTCGDCAFPNVCGAITPDMCGCVLNSCEALGVSVCGSFDDGCGGDLQCSCPAGQVCTALQLCAPDEGDPGESSIVGCSDGTREGFLNTETFPKIAACGGGWSVPGIHHGDGPSCGRVSGNSSANSDGLGCNVEDLCAEGWHVCHGDEDVVESSPSGCDGIMAGAESPAFFLARATFTPGKPWICSGDTVGTNPPANTDDIFGCGDMGCVTDQFDCKGLQLGSHNGCMGLNYIGCECDDSSPATTSCEGESACTYCYGLDYWEWQMSDEARGIQFDDVWECAGGSSEANNVVKSKSSQGGVLCCQDGDAEPGCVPQCAGKQCGEDGCGGTCGTCSLFETCTAGGICKCNPGLPPGSCDALP